jgi:sugar/nucleoside kinase (ribokinase family)
MQDLLVIGSLAYDSVQTPAGKAEKSLGGSANYFSAAASYFSKVKVVGVVGTDYRSSDKEILLSRNVDLEGLQVVPGQTFHWEGSYEGNLSEAVTHKTELNVFADFNPTIPESYKKTTHVFLANIDPELQLKVLAQIQNPVFVGMDSMNYWIVSKLDTLIEVVKKVNIIFINETEAKMLSKENNLNKALKKISSWGPEYVVLKRGEYGSLLYSKTEGSFNCPAMLVDQVVDPTGAGDSYAGGFFGYLTKNVQGQPQWSDLKQAAVQGTVMSSQTIQDFSLTALLKMNEAKLTTLRNELVKSISL